MMWAVCGAIIVVVVIFYAGFKVGHVFGHADGWDEAMQKRQADRTMELYNKGANK